MRDNIDPEIRRALESGIIAVSGLSSDSLESTRQVLVEPAALTGPTGLGSLTTRRLSDIETKPIPWLWPGRIARGKLTIVAGNPGLGKSQITASIAAIVTTGGRWPVDGNQCDPGDVVFLSAEDDPADTLRPRLEAVGADLTRVHFVDGVTVGYAGDRSRTERTFSLEEDIHRLDAKLKELGGVGMVVIDPITAYLGGTDSHKNSDVRGLLAPLSGLAARHGTAVICVSHLTKATGAQAMMRVTGSLAFVAASRAAYLVTVDPNDNTRRFFLLMKNNLGPDAAGLAFHIEGTTVPSAGGPVNTSRVSWESEPVPMTADEAMQAGNAPQQSSALDDARGWLEEVLGAGPISATELFERATAEGISRQTLTRAKKALGIKPSKVGMTGGWSWALPPKVLRPSKDAQVAGLTTFGRVEHLREPDEQMTEVEL